MPLGSSLYSQSWRVKVRDLTTAASIWVAAGLGAAVGCGLWQMGLLGASLTLTILSGMKRAKRLVKVHFRKPPSVSSSQSLISEERKSD